MVSLITAMNAGSSAFTMQSASWLIEQLFATPKPTAFAPSNEKPADLGYYLVDETVYVVVESKTSGKHYAKRMSVIGARGRWEYAHGMVYHLAGAHRLTVEEARILGRSLGCCMICGATLTDPESVERGIGPICETRVTGTYTARSGRRNTARSNGATMIAAARDEAARLGRLDEQVRASAPAMIVDCPGCEDCDGEGGTHRPGPAYHELHAV
jgi:hypothetical protein